MSISRVFSGLALTTIAVLSSGCVVYPDGTRVFLPPPPPVVVAAPVVAPVPAVVVARPRYYRPVYYRGRAPYYCGPRYYRRGYAYGRVSVW